jgi:hypothetical protein
VLAEILEDEHREPTAVQAAARGAPEAAPPESGEVYDAGDRRKIEDRLRRLGYLE